MKYSWRSSILSTAACHPKHYITLYLWNVITIKVIFLQSIVETKISRWSSCIKANSIFSMQFQATFALHFISFLLYFSFIILYFSPNFLVSFRCGFFFIIFFNLLHSFRIKISCLKSTLYLYNVKYIWYIIALTRFH